MEKFDSKKITEVLTVLKGQSYADCKSILKNTSFIIDEYFKNEKFTEKNQLIQSIVEKERFNPVKR